MVFKLWKLFFEYTVSNHENLLYILSLIFTLIFSVWILANSIIWPGPIFLSTLVNDSCPSQTLMPPIPDAAFLPISIVFYLAVIVFSMFFLFASGSLMQFPKRNKVTASSLLLIIVCSFIQLIATASLRSYTFEMQSIQPYNFNSTQISSTSLSISISDVYNQLISASRKQDVIFSAHKVDDSNVVVQDVLSKDENPFFIDTQLTLIDNGTIIQRTLDGLENGHWYLFLIRPAYKADLNDNIYPSNSYTSINCDSNCQENVLLKVPNGCSADFNNFLVNTQIQRFCHWDSNLGCLSS